MKITIPEFCLVVLVGAPGSGKSVLANAHFAADEIIVPMIGNDAPELAEDQSRLLQELIEVRLRHRQLTVVDAPNLRRQHRAMLVQVAHQTYAQAVSVVLTSGRQSHLLEESLEHIGKEGFQEVHVLSSQEELAGVTIERRRLRTDRRDESGPFDIIGDVHGCVDELIALLAKLGYAVEIVGTGEQRRVISRTPAGRRAVFVGDLVDRGPASPDVLRIVMHMIREGQALAVPGNHDAKLLRWLKGSKVKMTHGIAETISQLEKEPESFRHEVRTFIENLVSNLWLDGGRLAVAHAGIKEEMLGRASALIREFCLYGETSGETDEFGLPIRYHWAAEYTGETTIVYGHTPVPEAEWLNNTLCVDTGCVFGGRLTALRWPEREIVSVPAARAYAAAIRPFAHPPLRPGFSP